MFSFKSLNLFYSDFKHASYPPSINNELPDKKMYLHFPVAPPRSLRPAKWQNNLMTATILAVKLDPCHLVRHHKVTRTACPAVLLLIS